MQSLEISRHERDNDVTGFREVADFARNAILGTARLVTDSCIVFVRLNL